MLQKTAVRGLPKSEKISQGTADDLDTAAVNDEYGKGAVRRETYQRWAKTAGHERHSLAVSNRSLLLCILRRCKICILFETLSRYCTSYLFTRLPVMPLRCCRLDNWVASLHRRVPWTLRSSKRSGIFFLPSSVLFACSVFLSNKQPSLRHSRTFTFTSFILSILTVRFHSPTRCVIILLSFPSCLLDSGVPH